MSYTVRPAQVEELPALVEIERAAGELFRGTPYAHLADLEPTAPDPAIGRAWVACAGDGALVGFAEWWWVDGDAYLAELDVLPAHAGHRLGAALIDAVAGDAARAGLSALWLTTFRDIPWNAPYYRRLGFVEVPDEQIGPGLAGIRDRQTAGGLPRASRVVMARPLAPG